MSPPAERDRLRREVSDRFVLTVRQGTGLVRPWWGTMTHGIGHLSEAVWRTRTRPRLVRKMARAAAAMGAGQGQNRIVIVVEDQAG